jgi:thioredoxin 1
MITVKRFTASWCAPCKMVAPVIEQLSKELPDVTFNTVDIDKQPDVAEAYRVRSVPTILIIKNGEVVNSLVGAQPKQVYLAAIKEKML